MTCTRPAASCTMGALLCLAAVSVSTVTAANHATNVEELYTRLAGVTTPRLGVLSQGNFDSVHQLLPNGTTPVVYAHDSDLIQAVLNRSVDAGLVSGIPNPSTNLVTFSSTLVSPRGMFSCRDAECDTTIEALNAAMVRALNDGAAAAAARNNAPFEFVAVHTCRTNMVDRFPFPTPVAGDRLANASARGSLRIAALGPYNWSNDGDYLASPPTGFWPDFLSAMEQHFITGMGFGFERVWNPTSDGTMEMVLNNTADATEPYWTVDAFYNNRARQHTFALSCTTLGYDSTFFVRDSALDAASQEGDDDGKINDGALAAIVLGAALVAAVAVAILVIVRRERALKSKYAEIDKTVINNPVEVKISQSHM
eukprot:m.172824 g.172824  ORF g.172824 m.172824 type:complete len:368 (-) comp13588_c0_seq1:222-1325(-)